MFRNGKVKYKLVNFIIQSFRCADTIYSGVKPFSTIYCTDLAVLGNYEIDSGVYEIVRSSEKDIDILEVKGGLFDDV